MAAPFQPVLNGAETIINATLDDQECFTILHWFNLSGVVNQSALDLLLDGVEAGWRTYALPLLPVNYVFISVKAKALATQNGVAGEVFVPLPNIGTYGGGPFLPNNDSIAITHKASISGKAGRGRSFWPALPRQVVVGNYVSSAYASSCVGVFDQIQIDLLGDNWQFSVLSKVLNKAPRLYGLLSPVTSNGVTDLVVDSMRRRLPKRGA